MITDASGSSKKDIFSFPIGSSASNSIEIQHASIPRKDTGGAKKEIFIQDNNFISGNGVPES